MHMLLAQVSDFEWGRVALFSLSVGVFALGVVLGAVWVGTRLWRGYRGPARRLLAERFARGEVSPEEYSQRLRLIDRSGHSDRRMAVLALLLLLLGIAGSVVIASPLIEW
ncbi:MAG TPA: hypothetical protein VHI54_00795 [Actinomycetota bacterium]|nr:hypothetical protein [Actinomycetota bacterium]